MTKSYVTNNSRTIFFRKRFIHIQFLIVIHDMNSVLTSYMMHYENVLNPPFHSHFISSRNHRSHKNCFIYDYIFLMIHFLLIAALFSPFSLLTETEIYETIFLVQFWEIFFQSDCSIKKMWKPKHPEDRNRLMLFNPKKEITARDCGWSK